MILTSYYGIYALGVYGVCLVGVLLSSWAVRALRVRRAPHPFEAGSLRYAAASGNVAALDFLSKRDRFDVDCSHEGFTALHAACVCGRTNAVRWLLRHGADVHALKADGWKDTALHYAASKRHSEVCRLLVAFGADRAKENFEGRTPFDLAPDMHFLNPAEALDGYDMMHIRNDDVPAPPSRDCLDWVLKRRWDSYGAEGTKPYPQLVLTRIFVIVAGCAGLVYVAWRACRTTNTSSTFATVFSVSLLVAELFMMTQFFCSLLLMWQPITREDRKLSDMMSPDAMPSVDIFIVTYSEPEYIVEEAIYAALNQSHPRVTVHVMDDGSRPEMESLVDSIRAELFDAGRSERLVYTGRPKVKGVHHHAKAGNINHTLTKAPESDADFVLVLDCDMIALESMLDTMLGHFYESNGSGGWKLKEKAAMVQVPQRFHNLGPKDPWWHTAEDFNAAGFEGSDGVGATPCVGTGVLFRRACLVAIGGQSYWSVTEDFKTSSNLLSQGFSTMYLARDLVYGIAVDDVLGIQKQRLRWSEGGLEILQQDMPLFRTGLSPAATVLFFANAWQYVLSVPSMLFLIAPLVYLYTNVSPVDTFLLEVAVFLGGFLIITRSMQWWQVRLISCISKDLCLWRGCQQVVWLAPLFFESLCAFVWKHYVRPIFGAKKHSTFVVSAKGDISTPALDVVRSSWFVWTFYVLFALGVVENFVLASVGVWDLDLDFALHLALGVLLCWYVAATLFPIVSVLLPCIAIEPKGVVVWVPKDADEHVAVVIEDDNANVTCWGTDQFVRSHGCFGPQPPRKTDNIKKVESWSTESSDRPRAVRASDKAESKIKKVTSVVSLDEMVGGNVRNAMSPGLDKRPRFHLPPYMQNHYKFRVVYGTMILVATVGVPILAVFVYRDTRFLVWGSA